MRIKEFCRVTGLSRNTVNFYVRRGLLAPAGNGSPSNAYRDFDERLVETARMIAQAKALGFSLSEIKSMADRYRDAGDDRAAQAKLLRQQLVRLDERARVVEEMRRALQAKLRRLEGPPGA